MSQASERPREPGEKPTGGTSSDTIDFCMPSLGADMEQGTLLEWLVKPGDEVHRGQIVAVSEHLQTPEEL